MPVFTQSLRRIDFSNPVEALREMANHIRYIQEQLEYTLTNLDSSNISEINTNETNISSSTGGSSFSGDNMRLAGPGGEQFEVGTVGDTFRFTLKGKGGKQFLYLTSDGQLVITNNATITIDGGEW